MPAARHFQSLDTALPPLYKLVAILNHRKENLFFHKYLSTVLHHCRLWLSLMCNWDIISWTRDKTLHDSAICHNIFSRAVWWKYRFLPRSQLWSEWRGGEWGEFYRAVPAAAQCAPRTGTGHPSQIRLEMENWYSYCTHGHLPPPSSGQIHTQCTVCWYSYYQDP